MTTTAIGFKKSMYYALNTTPIIKRCHLKEGGWADRKLNAVVGFESKTERLQFLQTIAPIEVSLGGSAFVNFTLAIIGTALSVAGTAPLCLERETSYAPLAAFLWLGGGLINVAALNNFFERSAMLRFSPDLPQLPLLAKTLKRVVLGAFGAVGVMLGEKVIVAAGTFLGQGLGWHLLAMGFLFMGSQWLLWNADFCKCHTALSE